MKSNLRTDLIFLPAKLVTGKSIIIDALSLILGDRASSDVVRKGSNKTIVEGFFGMAENDKIKTLLKQNKIELQDDLILRREVSVKGQSRCFVNDSPVPLTVLKEIGDYLVDLHGQHEHQSLLRSETHISLLDEFGSLDKLVDEYRESYDRLSLLFMEFRSLSLKEKELKEKRDLYEFQIKEIDAVDPHAGEEINLENELRILENSEKLFEATSQLYHSLYEGEPALQNQENIGGQSVYDLLLKARNQLEDLAEIDNAFEDIKNECASAAAIVGELTKFIQSYNSKIEFNPDQLEQIRERLGQITLLKKKYGGSLDVVIEHRKKIGKEFVMAENFESEIRKLSEYIDLERKVCSDAAQRLSTKRRELVGKISKSVCTELIKLGIANVQFDVKIENRTLGKIDSKVNSAYVKLGRDFYDATQNGIDFIEFFLRQILVRI